MTGHRLYCKVEEHNLSSYYNSVWAFPNPSKFLAVGFNWELCQPINNLQNTKLVISTFRIAKGIGDSLVLSKCLGPPNCVVHY